MPQPFDTVDTALNMARTRLNDAIASLSGDVLTNDQPFTTQIFQGADPANLSLLATWPNIAVGLRFTTRIRYPVFGEYIRIVVTNDGAGAMKPRRCWSNYAALAPRR